MRRLNDRLLQHLGARWNSTGSLSLDPIDPITRRAFVEAARSLVMQSFGTVDCVVLKDPRLCRLLPLWLEALAECDVTPRCVLCVRNPIEVVRSLYLRNGLQASTAESLWLRHVLDAERDSRHCSRTVVRYDALLRNWRQAVADIERDLQWRFPRRPEDAEVAEEIDTFLRPDLRHHDSASGAQTDRYCIDLPHRRAAPELRRVVRVFSAFQDSPSQRAALDAVSAALDARDATTTMGLATDAEMQAAQSESHATISRERRESRLVLQRHQMAASQRFRHATRRTLAPWRPLKAEECAAMLARLDGCDALEWRQTSDSGATRQPDADDARAMLTSGLFDPFWYRLRYPEIDWDVHDPLHYWLTEGYNKDHDPVPLFDGHWYRNRYPDVAASGDIPLLHYLHCGAHEGRVPGPLFDGAWQPANAEPTDASDPRVTNLLGRYLRDGLRRGDSPMPYLAPRWYARRYPDVAASGLPALLHFLLIGEAECRNPGPRFDAGWYLVNYPDVARAGTSPLRHFLTFGRDEGRLPIPPPRAIRVFRQRLHTTELTARPDPDLLTPTAMDMRRARLVVESAAKPPAFSIIMPTWNRRQVIDQAIDSVLRQSYRHWELIVCDDGSTDGTEAFLHSHYAEALAKGKLRYIQQPHTGVCAARNAGLTAAKGTWIAYLDSDNTWHPDYLLHCAETLLTHPEAMTVYACLTAHGPHFAAKRTIGRAFDWPSLMQGNYVDVNVFAHHRQLFEDLGGFDTALHRLEDWDLILRYTRLYPAHHISLSLCDYNLSEALENVTLREPEPDNLANVRRNHARYRLRDAGEPPRIAFVLDCWPPTSSSLDAMLKYLLRRGVAPLVYCRQISVVSDRIAPAVAVQPYRHAEDLGDLLREQAVNWLCGMVGDTCAITDITCAAKHHGLAFSLITVPEPTPSVEARAAIVDAALQHSPLFDHILTHNEPEASAFAEAGLPLAMARPAIAKINAWPHTLSGQAASSTSETASPAKAVVMVGDIESPAAKLFMEAAAMLARTGQTLEIMTRCPDAKRTAHASVIWLAESGAIPTDDTETRELLSGAHLLVSSEHRAAHWVPFCGQDLTPLPADAQTIAARLRRLFVAGIDLDGAPARRRKALLTGEALARCLLRDLLCTGDAILFDHPDTCATAAESTDDLVRAAVHAYRMLPLSSRVTMRMSEVGTLQAFRAALPDRIRTDWCFTSRNAEAPHVAEASALHTWPETENDTTHYLTLRDAMRELDGSGA